MWYRVPVPRDSGLLIPFWTGFSLGLLRTQLGSLDSLPTGLMFLTPGSHVYLSCGYPLPSSIIKQTCHLFFFSCISFSGNFLKVWWRVKAAVNMDGTWRRWACSLLSPRPPSHLAPSGALPSRPFFSPVNAPCFSPSTALLFTQLSLLHPVSLQTFVEDSGLLLLPCLFLLAAEGGEAGYGFLSSWVGWNQCTKGKPSDLR